MLCISNNWINTDPMAKWLESSSMAWETGVQSQTVSYQKLKKMVLDIFLFDTQHYKVRIKGKVEQSRESSDWKGYIGAIGVVAVEKGTFGSPLTTVVNFTFSYLLYKIWFGWVLWHISRCRLFNAKSCLYIYIEYKDLIWSGFKAYQQLLVI